MGDRAIVVFTDDQETSPAIYVHWLGIEVASLLRDTYRVMSDRGVDVQYTAARFVEKCAGREPGNTGLGIWNSSYLCGENGKLVRERLSEKSPGDAGVILVAISERDDELIWNCSAHGGYGLQPDGVEVGYVESYEKDLAIAATPGGVTATAPESGSAGGAK
jgi:hypothetical protein